MKNITFTVGKSSTGYDAYYEVNNKIVAITTGDSLAQLKANALEAYNLYISDTAKRAATADDIKFQYDLPALFEFYKEISASGLSDRVGMNKTLLSQYVNGKKKVSPKQINKILSGIKELGKELSRIELV